MDGLAIGLERKDNVTDQKGKCTFKLQAINNWYSYVLEMINIIIEKKKRWNRYPEHDSGWVPGLPHGIDKNIITLLLNFPFHLLQIHSKVIGFWISAYLNFSSPVHIRSINHFKYLFFIHYKDHVFLRCKIYIDIGQNLYSVCCTSKVNNEGIKLEAKK